MVARAGVYVAIPRLTEYSFTVDVPSTEFLNFCTPAGFDQITVGTSQPAQTSGPPPSDLRPCPSQQFQTLCSQYGLIITGGMPTVDPSGSESTPPPTKATPAATLFPCLTNNQTAPAYWVRPVIPELWTMLASAQHTNSTYTLTDMLIPQKGNAASPLSYASHDETYYILFGTATFLLGYRVEQVGSGDFVFIPRGTVFALRVDSENTRALVWHTPSGIIEGCRPLMGGRPAEDRTEPPADLEGPDVDPGVFMARAKELGIRILAVTDPLK